MNVALIASIFGPILVFTGLWSLFYQENVTKVVEAIKKNPAILYLGGIINLIFGLMIIQLCPRISLDLFGLVPLLGWALFLRGLCVFFLPSLIARGLKMPIHYYKVFGLIGIAWGLILCWVAYM